MMISILTVGILCLFGATVNMISLCMDIVTPKLQAASRTFKSQQYSTLLEYVI